MVVGTERRGELFELVGRPLDYSKVTETDINY